MKRLVSIKDKSLEVTKILTDEEFELINHQINRVLSLHERTLQIMYVVKIFDEIKTSIANNSRDTHYRLLREFLSNFSSFIDYWEKRVNKDFGKNSDQSRTFKESTHNMYDNVYAYRFTCELRNYIEHYEIPKIKIASRLDNDNTIVHSLTLSCKDLLDSSFKWKKKVEEDLQKIKTEIDLLKAFPLAIKSIERINDIALSFYDIENDLKSCNEILEYEKSKKEGSQLAIAEFPADYPNKINGMTVSIREFPFNLARYFLKQIELNEK